MISIKKEKKEEFLKEVGSRFEIVDFSEREDGLSFKDYFFPPLENIQIVPPKKKLVIFGLDKIDLEALTYLDEIMSSPVKDSLYWARRERAIIIGLGDEEANKFVEKYKDYLEELNGIKNFSLEHQEWQKKIREVLIDSELLAGAVEWSRNNSKIWDELAEKCLGCGICTYVCPLCHCFSMEDRIDLKEKCSRCRKWDACTLPDFSKVAGGHDFRPTIKERYYNWFYHKFVRAYKEYGKSQCVGCYRCKKFCPAGIDILEVLKRILEEYGQYLSSQKSEN